MTTLFFCILGVLILAFIGLGRVLYPRRRSPASSPRTELERRLFVQILQRHIS